MGLEGMIEDVMKQCDFELPSSCNYLHAMQLDEKKDIRKVARQITNAENVNGFHKIILTEEQKKIPVLGITGTGGAGKSSVTDELVRRFLQHFIDKTIAVISVDPSKKKTGGALLGDRIRMNSISNARVYMRSMATRDDNTALSAYMQDAIEICKHAGFDLIILESAGVGQSDASILDFCDLSLYIMTPEYGAASQLEKINMLDYADIVCINKFDKAGALDSLHDLRKQYKRNHNLWNVKDDELPIVGTIAAQFNDLGINELFIRLVNTMVLKTGVHFGPDPSTWLKGEVATQTQIIPPKRVRYLSEIAEQNRSYDAWATEQAAIASKLYQINGTIQLIHNDTTLKDQNAGELLRGMKNHFEGKLHPECKRLMEEWPTIIKKYNSEPQKEKRRYI
jgi:methylmalonyl-CoA mutase